MNDAQIAGIKNRLKLSPKQAEYWPKVEAALRDVVQHRLQRRERDQNGAWVLDVNSPDVQLLVQASAPLIRELRPPASTMAVAPVGLAGRSIAAIVAAGRGHAGRSPQRSRPWVVHSASVDRRDTESFIHWRLRKR